MALKKVYSVDYAASGGAGDGGPTRGGVANTAGGPRNRNAPLTHSISIVVELAKESPQSQVALNSSHRAAGEEFGRQESSTSEEIEEAAEDVDRRLVETPTTTTTSDDDDDDDDDEDDGSECLASDLARKIVLVDEADRILRTRAQSAEPTPLAATPACLASARPPAPDEAERNPDAAVLSRASFAQHTRGGAPGSGCRCCARRSIGGSSGELAERGELRKLSMRRNTHHQLGDAQLGEMAARPAHSRPPLSQTLSSAAAGGAPRPSALAAGASAQGNLAPSGLLRNWPAHRRQSLQISLLSGGACSPCKFLNEEEVRGEREFNEQLRSLKSPDSYYQQQQKQKQHQLQSAVAAATSGKLDFTCSLSDFESSSSSSYPTHQAAGRQQRCRSTSGLDPRELVAAGILSHKTQTASGERSAQQQAIATTGGASRQYQQTSGRQLQRHQRRRVSFSCVDPVISSPQKQQPLATRLATSSIQQKRASIAYHPGHFKGHSPSSSSPTQQSPPPISASILKNATPLRHSQPPARDFQTQPGPSAAATTTSGQQQKRHSLACTSFVANASQAAPSLPPRPPALQNQRSAGSIVASGRRKLDQRQQQSTGSEMDEATGKRRAEEPAAAETRDNTNSSLSSSDPPATSTQPLVTTTSSTATTTTTTTTTEPDQLQGEHQRTGKQSTMGHRGPTPTDVSRVQSIMANARLRQEEFARLLEEHEQIVNEINRVETKISSSQTNLQQ